MSQKIKKCIQFANQHGEEKAADQDVAIAHEFPFLRQEEVNKYDAH